jgi:peptidyl-prolyl cis-trans isomerase C
MATALQPDVIVNGEVIPAAAVAAEAQNHPAPRGKPGLAWRAAARALAVRALLLQEARSLGLTPAPRALGDGRRETDEEALIRAVLAARVTPDPVDEAAVAAAYEADPARFRGPALYEAAHILIPAAPGDAGARTLARRQAQAVIDRLAADPAAFDRLAAEHSACPSRAEGGRLGQIASGDTVPEFEAALAAMEEGAIVAAPVETRYGLHVIRLDARAEGRVPPLAAVRHRLREALEKAAWTRAARAFTTALAARATLSGVDLGAEA